MVNYDSISGVTYRRYNDDDSPDEPTTGQEDAKVEELYFDTGKLHLTLETADGFLSIQIPVLATNTWDGFVDTLPTWGDE